MKEHKNYRYLLLVMGACVQFCCGIAYMWSVFQPYAIKKYALDTSAANLPFGVLLGVFVLGNLSGGFLQKKWNVRWIILVGTTIMCFGLFATAFIPVSDPWLLNVTYGGMAGFGCGVTYNTVLATLQRWFPDKSGLVTGIIICSAGLFGLVMNPIANKLLGEYGFQTAMAVVAVILFVVSIVAGSFIRAPHEHYLENFSSNSDVAFKKQFTTEEMVHTKQYYIVAITFALAVPSYFLMNPMLMSLGVERGLSTGTALIGVMLVSVMNTTGRLVMPWISDRLGRKGVLQVLFALNIVTVLLLTTANGYGFLILVSLIALFYGGFMGMYPTINADFFGTKHAGVNYGIVMLGYAISSISCPYLVRAVAKTSMGISLSFVIAAVASGLGFLLVLMLKRPE